MVHLLCKPAYFRVFQNGMERDGTEQWCVTMLALWWCFKFVYMHSDYTTSTLASLSIWKSMEVEYSKYKKLTNLLRYYELGYQDTGWCSSEDFCGISLAYVCLTFNNDCISHLWLLAGGGCTFYIYSVFISCVMFFFITIANFSFQNSHCDWCD